MRKAERQINYDDCINSKQRNERLLIMRRQNDLRKLDMAHQEFGMPQKELEEKHRDYLNFKKGHKVLNPNDELIHNVLQFDQNELNYERLKHVKYDNKIEGLQRY